MSDAQIEERLQSTGKTKVTASDIKNAKKVIKQLENDEISVHPQDVQVINQAFSMAELTAGILFARPWVLAKTPPSLITTDEPVHPIAGPGGVRHESVGVGHAGIVAFPLGPDWVLLAVRPDLSDRLGLPHDLEQVVVDELDYPETFALGRELLMGATRWAFERPDRKVVAHFLLPPRSEEVSTQELTNETDDTTLVRMFSKNRWANTSYVLEWPLERYWAPGWRVEPLPKGLGDIYEAHKEELLERMRGD